MSSVSMGYQTGATQSGSEDLNRYIMDGLARHNAKKRTRMRDVTMESPTRKRSKHH